MKSSLSRLLSAERVNTFIRSVQEIFGSVSLHESAGKGTHSLSLPFDETVHVKAEKGSDEQKQVMYSALRHLLAYEHEVVDLTHELSGVYEELTLLYRLGQAFSETLELESIQKHAIDEIADTLDVKKISLLMLNESRDGLILNTGMGVNPKDIGRQRFKKDEGLAWRVVREGQSIIANDISAFADYVPGDRKEHSILLVPVTTKRGLSGVLSVSDKSHGGEFTSKDEKLLSTIATQMGAVWENARLYRETRELFLNTVEALSAAIDAKDPYTHGHSQRVTAFSLAIARQMSLPGEEIELIRISALLHDIGKLGISEGILRKPDRLTNDEFGEIKKHPAIGADIMGKVKTLTRFIPGMIDHHERFDGSGYPLGRKGKEISLAGRIIAVADTLDAMTSDRPYHPDRKGKPDDAAITEIKRCNQTHFDPEVVEAFLKAYSCGDITTQWAGQAA